MYIICHIVYTCMSHCVYMHVTLCIHAGDSEEEVQQEGGVRLPGTSTRRGRGLSQAMGGRRRQQSFFNSSSSSMMTSQRGVVYFSDLDQLRAALKEMHNYRLVTRTSRSGGEGVK